MMNVPGVRPQDYGLEVKVVKISPVLAEHWLGLNRSNRNPKRQNVARFRRDIEDANWRLTGETIIFDRLGHLRNGQNRLMACVEAEKDMTSLVVWGVDPAAVVAMDSGAARTYGDVLAIDSEGELANTHALGALAATVFRWEHGYPIVGGGQATNPTLQEVLDTVVRHPLLPSSIAPAVTASKVAYLRPPRVGAYCHYRFAMIDSDLADDFFRRLNNLDFRPGADEVLKLLRLTLQRMGERDRSHRDSYKVLCYVIKAWRVWRGIDPPITRFQMPSTPPDVE